MSILNFLFLFLSSSKFAFGKCWNYVRLDNLNNRLKNILIEKLLKLLAYFLQHNHPWAQRNFFWWSENNIWMLDNSKQVYLIVVNNLLGVWKRKFLQHRFNSESTQTQWLFLDLDAWLNFQTLMCFFDLLMISEWRILCLVLSYYQSF